MNKPIKQWNLDECVKALSQYDTSALIEGIVYRQDDRATGIFNQSLRKYAQKIVEQRSPKADIQSLIPHKWDLQFGENEIISTVAEAYGSAAFGNMSDDVPYVEVNIDEETDDIATLRTGFRYTEEELESAIVSMANRRNPSFNLIRRKMEAADKALREYQHLVGIYGKANLSLYGLFNNPYVVTYDETTVDPLNTATTTEDLYEWFIRLHSIVLNQTNLLGQVDTIMMSQALLDKLMMIRPSSSSDRTAWELIKVAMTERGIRNFYVRQEVSKTWLEQYGFFAPNTNKDMLIFLSTSEDVVCRWGSTIKLSPLTFVNGQYEQYYRQRFSSVRFDQPLEALYVTYPNTL